MPCRSYIEKLAPAPEKDQAFTLEDYYHPTTYSYRLISSGDSTAAEEVDFGSAYAPRYLDQTDSRLASPDLKELPRFPASNFTIVRTFESDGVEFCDVPKEVRQSENGVRLAFKAAYDSESLIREIQVYAAIRSIPRLDETFCVPRFHGIVLLHGKILGLVLEYIDHDATMSERSGTASHEEKARWLRQIDSAVEILHQTGWAWGDVKPENVLIRTDGRACVIDFGGGFHPRWIDEEFCNTEAGDLQALQRIRESLQV